MTLYRAVALVLSWVLIFNSTAWAQRSGPSILRDSELEHSIRVLTIPLFEAAGLTKESVHTYIVNDRSLNAFVAGGQNVFVNSGLILQAKNVNEVIGVVAHETGHISGGHLARFNEGLKGATAISILGMVLGAAAIVGGAGDAGAAIALGSQQAATRSVLSYSRTQESAADQAGLKFLEATGQSGEGLVSFLEYLGDQEALITKNKDPYVRSHPVTSDRVAALREAVESSPHAHAEPSPEYLEIFKRMQAKLGGYLNQPYVTFQKYPPGDQSLYGRYARAYAYHQQHEFDLAMAEAESLLKDYPNDPFFWELKGFLLFENGMIRESIPPYQRSVELKDDEPLILTALGQAMLALEDPALNDEAIGLLEKANRYEKDNSFTWRQLATAYYRNGDQGMTHLATAESYVLTGDIQATMIHASQALKQLKTGSPSWLRAQDIMFIARSNMPEKMRSKMEPPENEGDNDAPPPPDGDKE